MAQTKSKIRARGTQFDFFAQAKRGATRSSDPQAHRPTRVSHGGSAAAGLRKLTRPLDRKRPIHIVLRSSHARGRMSLRAHTHRLAIDNIVQRAARRYGMRIHSFANVGNHLHLLASFSKRELFQNFLRVVTGLIARLVTGAQKGKPFGKRFWDHLAFTRVVKGLRGFNTASTYVEANQVEALAGPWERARFMESPRKYDEELEDFWDQMRTLATDGS